VTDADRDRFIAWLKTGSPSTRNDLISATTAGLVVQVEVIEGEVYVSLFAAENGDCCLGHRDADGRVNVWSPPRVTVQPGEAGCSPATAHHPVPPPH